MPATTHLRRAAGTILLLMIAITVSGCGGGTTGTSTIEVKSISGEVRTTSSAPIANKPMVLLSDQQSIGSQTEDDGSFDMTALGSSFELRIEDLPSTVDFESNFEGSSSIDLSIEVEEGSGRKPQHRKFEVQTLLNPNCDSQRIGADTLLISTAHSGAECSLRFPSTLDDRAQDEVKITISCLENEGATVASVSLPSSQDLPLAALTAARCNAYVLKFENTQYLGRGPKVTVVLQ